MTAAPVPLAEQPTDDEKRLADIRVMHSGTTMYEGRTERMSEFLLRLLDEARAERDAYAERWRSVTKECDGAALQQHERALGEARQKVYLDAMGCCTPEPGEAWSREYVDAGDLIWGRICDIGNRASRPLTVTKPLVTAYEAGKAEAAEQHERLVAELDATKVVLEDEEAAHQDTLRLWQEVKQKHERAMAALRELTTMLRVRPDMASRCGPAEIAVFNHAEGVLAEHDAANTAGDAVTATPAGKREP